MHDFFQMLLRMYCIRQFLSQVLKIQMVMRISYFDQKLLAYSWIHKVIEINNLFLAFELNWTTIVVLKSSLSNLAFKFQNETKQVTCQWHMKPCPMSCHAAISSLSKSYKINFWFHPNHKKEHMQNKLTYR